MDEVSRCVWCGEQRRRWSRWEQQDLAGEWSRLCASCARKRLRNPLNAVLSMREVG